MSRPGCLDELGQDLLHRPVQVDPDAVLVLAAVLVGDETPRIAVHLFEPDAVPVDLRLDVAVGGAGDAHPDRAGGAVARQADDADVVGEVFAAELGADPELVAPPRGACLSSSDVAEGLAVLVAVGGEVVQVSWWRRA